MRVERTIIAVVALGMGTSLSADTIFVTPPGSIQDAIMVAQDGDDVSVGPGTYHETIDFMGKAIAVRAVQGPELTTITGAGLGESVVRCASGEGQTTILEGFTITGGDAFDGGGMFNLGSSPLVVGCRFLGNRGEQGGGMINVSAANPTVIDCVFSGNEADLGGGMFNAGSSPTLLRCHFSVNHAREGGGMWNGPASPVLRDCEFTSNHAYLSGGAIHDEASRLTLIGCRFTTNSSESDGGALHVIERSMATVQNCFFLGNDGGFGYGGAVYVDGSEISLTSTVLARNTTGTFGAAVYSSNSDLTVSSCTFTANFTLGVGGAIYNAHTDASLRNSVFWGDICCTDKEIVNTAGSVTSIHFCDVDGSSGSGAGWDATLGIDAGGNIDLFPEFVDADGPDGIPDTFDDNDYRLAANSMCIDAGATWLIPNDRLDLDDDGDVSELMPLDLGGSPRFVDDPATTPNDGCGPVPVDMGAYEYAGLGGGGPNPMRVGDVNGDGFVDVLDMVQTILEWGDCTPAPDGECCNADFDVDGAVDRRDLEAVLVNWD